MKKPLPSEIKDQLSGARRVQAGALKAIHQVSEPEQVSGFEGSPLSPDETQAMAKAMAKIRIVSTIEALREGRAIERASALFLAEALEKALSNPAKAAEAFGIERPRGRGASDATYLKLAIHVDVLKKMGFALPQSNKDRGAYKRVAVHFRVSVDTVERAWKRHRDLLGKLDVFKATEQLNS